MANARRRSNEWLLPQDTFSLTTARSTGRFLLAKSFRVGVTIGLASMSIARPSRRWWVKRWVWNRAEHGGVDLPELNAKRWRTGRNSNSRPPFSEGRAYGVPVAIRPHEAQGVLLWRDGPTAWLAGLGRRSRRDESGPALSSPADLSGQSSPARQPSPFVG